MYVRQTNKTAIRSQHMIADAMYNIMKKKRFQRITVTEICEKAGVGRKTFYRNFETKEDVLDFFLDYLFEEYREAIQDLSTDEKIQYHFKSIEKHADVLIMLYQNDFIQLANRRMAAMIRELVPYLASDPVKYEYVSQYIAWGLEGIEHAWIDRGFQESHEEIVEITKAMLRSEFNI